MSSQVAKRRSSQKNQSVSTTADAIVKKENARDSPQKKGVKRRSKEQEKAEKEMVDDKADDEESEGEADSSDDDSYDSEEEENLSFIADEEDVQREMEQEIREKNKELYGSGEKKKKRKKIKKPLKLDDDDHDLIKENTGIQTATQHKRKRLKKLKKTGDQAANEDETMVNDSKEQAARVKSEKLDRIESGGHQSKALKSQMEKMEVEDKRLVQHQAGRSNQDTDHNDTPQQQIQTGVSKSKKSGAVIKKQDQDDDDEYLDEMQDDIGALNKKKSFQMPENSKVNIDRLNSARSIFNIDTYDKMMAPGQLKEENFQKEQNESMQLQEMYENDDLDDPLSTPQDKLIADTDVPERIQVKLQGRLDPQEKEIEEESIWVYDRLYEIIESDRKLSFKDNPQLIQQKIRKIIKQFRCDKFDIPQIVKYRAHEYKHDLQENDIWKIFNLDIEYGKFKQQKAQIYTFIKNLLEFDPQLEFYLHELHFVNTFSELKNYQALISFMKSYYSQQLMALDASKNLKKLPSRNDFIQTAKRQKIDEYARQCLLRPIHFTENIQEERMKHQPLQPSTLQPGELAKNYQKDISAKIELSFFRQVSKFAAIEISCQPLIRRRLKDYYNEYGVIKTEPTEKGKKDLDVFHPSYRVKRISKSLRSLKGTDLYLDIVQSEKQGLITSQVVLESEDIQQNSGEQGNYLLQKFFEDLQKLYIPLEDSEDPKVREQTRLYNVLRTEVFNHKYYDKGQSDASQQNAGSSSQDHKQFLIQEIVKEIRDELCDDCENFVIQLCQNKYREMLMLGPYQRENQGNDAQNQAQQSSGNRKAQDHDIIKDRDRLSVMGVLMHQTDNNCQLVTVAVVDKFGYPVAHKEFMNLIPPRRPRPGAEGDRQYQQNLKQQQRDHEKDLEEIRSMLLKHDVELIVVSANQLKAQDLFKCLQDLGSEKKNQNLDDEDVNMEDDDENRQQLQKEAIVIWGSTEIPKLFSSSHNSNKLLSKTPQMLKQAICLARYEQDPICEIMNLWSPQVTENQTLNINMHPLQRMINQPKLADKLEEINVEIMNEIGIDLNLIVQYDHMHSMLQFISGLGPRKAKKYISKIKGRDAKIQTRIDIYQKKFLEIYCFLASIAFTKIKVPYNKRDTSTHHIDILDQTRIHNESYNVALKIASDANIDPDEQNSNNQYEKVQQQIAVKEVIKNPNILKKLDLEQYKNTLRMSGNENVNIIIDFIKEELEHPFKDPRKYRSPSTRANIEGIKLFYLLIDETPRTLKPGMIVTATVSKVKDDFIMCRLENGLDARVFKDDMVDSNQDEKLQSVVDVGHVITGRIDEIKDFNKQPSFGFYLKLKCKKNDLKTHSEHYFQNDLKGVNIPKEDLINQDFQIDQSNQQNKGILKRRIQHPKFLNLNCNQSIRELQSKDVGDYIFRPSSRGIDNLTLTWKFYTNNITHIDIQEYNKLPNTSIGTKLVIGEESFDNLQEIVERFILPCNRAIKEVLNHPKFVKCKDITELKKILQDEKNEDNTRIPYRFTIVEQYPQFVLMGYIPRVSMVKEFIRVKPRGFYFHDQYHNPFQNLINWFKENFKQPAYQKQLKRCKSPQMITGQRPVGGQSGQASNEQYQGGRQSKNSDHMWGNEAQGASVHSMNDDNIKKEANTNMSSYNRDRSSHYNNSSSYGRGQRRPQNNNNDSSFPQRQSHDNQGGFNTKFEDRNSPSQGWGNNANQQNNNNQESQGGWGNSSTQKDQNPQATQGWGNNQNSNNNSPRNQDGDHGSKAASGWGKNSPDGQNNFGQENSGGNWGAGGRNSNMDNGGSPDNRSERSYGGNRGRGRGGRGRGGQDGRPSRGCFKCGEEGHFARECPNQDRNQDNDSRGGRGGFNRGGDNRGKGCFKCGEEGHFARDCPNQDSDNRDSRGRGGRGRGRGGFGEGRGGRACFKCNEEGHMARDCPNSDRRENGNDGYPQKRFRRDDGGSSRRENNYQQSSSGFGGGGWKSSGNQNNDDQNNSGGWGATGSNNFDNFDSQNNGNNNTQGGQQEGWGASSFDNVQNTQQQNNDNNGDNTQGWGN